MLDPAATAPVRTPQGILSDYLCHLQAQIGHFSDADCIGILRACWNVHRAVAGRFAVQTLARTLSPRGSRWQQAQAVSKALQRFSVGYKRIQSGYRRPQSDLEHLMVLALDSGCPGSARRIFDLLT